MIEPLPLPDDPNVVGEVAVMDTAIVASLTAALTYGARKFLTRKDATALDSKPQVLFWISAAAAVASGAITSVVQGQPLQAGLVNAATGWMAAQGLRRAKKGVGVS